MSGRAAETAMHFQMDELSAIEEQVARLIAGGEVSDEVFNETALDIYRFQRKHNEPFGNYCRQLGAPLEINDWREIPAVPQSAFKHFPLRCFPERETVKTFRTSGTTGEGFGEHHFRSMRLYDASILATWDFFRLPCLPQIVLTPSPAQAPHSSLSHMMGVLRARALGGVQHFCITDEGGLQMEDVARLVAERSTPVMVLGSALAFLHWCERGAKLRLPAGSCALETGGYKGSGRSLEKRALYELITAHLGLTADDLINEYGMTELSTQFYTRGLGEIHRGPPWARALVIDPETNCEVALGEIGTLRVIDLANVGSVLAIQTQDLAVRREEGFELLGRDPSALPRGCSRSADEMLSRDELA